MMQGKDLIITDENGGKSKVTIADATNLTDLIQHGCCIAKTIKLV
jgi:hypothetical protein